MDTSIYRFFTGIPVDYI